MKTILNNFIVPRTDIPTTKTLAGEVAVLKVERTMIFFNYVVVYLFSTSVRTFLGNLRKNIYCKRKQKHNHIIYYILLEYKENIDHTTNFTYILINFLQN